MMGCNQDSDLCLRDLAQFMAILMTKPCDLGVPCFQTNLGGVRRCSSPTNGIITGRTHPLLFVIHGCLGSSYFVGERWSKNQNDSGQWVKLSKLI